MSYSKDAWTISEKAVQRAMEQLQSEVEWQSNQLAMLHDQIAVLRQSRDEWKHIAENAISDLKDISVKNFDTRPALRMAP
jgi:chromosome segregation ATPase